MKKVMIKQSLFARLLFILIINIWMSCDYGAEKYNSPAQYDLNHPVKIDMPSELKEISGIVYYAKDSTVFAISDETGWLYKIFARKNVTVQKWKFGKNDDYEDLQLIDSTFYILPSDGNIVQVNFTANDTPVAREFDFPKERKNEFESLYYDRTSHLLNMICKNCKDEKKDRVSIWTFNPLTDSFGVSPVSIDVTALAKKFGKKKLELKPSAAAMNPITNELYILSSINKVLIIADNSGMVKEAYPLDPAIYKQPEGLTFTPSGDLLISNEAADEGSANILVMKLKKKK